MIICYLPPIKGTSKLHWWFSQVFWLRQQLSTDWNLQEFPLFSLASHPGSGDILQNWEFEAPKTAVFCGKVDVNDRYFQPKCCRYKSFLYTSCLLKLNYFEPKTLVFFVGRTESVSSKRDPPKKCNGHSIIFGPEYGTKKPLFFGGCFEIPTFGDSIIGPGPAMTNSIGSMGRVWIYHRNQGYVHEFGGQSTMQYILIHHEWLLFLKGIIWVPKTVRIISTGCAYFVPGFRPNGFGSFEAMRIFRCVVFHYKCSLASTIITSFQRCSFFGFFWGPKLCSQQVFEVYGILCNFDGIVEAKESDFVWP